MKNLGRGLGKTQEGTNATDPETKREIQVSLETKSGAHFAHAIKMNKSHTATDD